MDQDHSVSEINISGTVGTMLRNAVSTPFLVLDPEGNILAVSRGFNRTFGYLGGYLTGKSFSQLFLEEDRHKGIPEKEVETAVRTGSRNGDSFLLRGDGIPRWVHGESIFIKDDLGRELIIKVIRDIHNEKILAEELGNKTREQEKTISDRNMFIHTVSHDLKAPLSNIEGLVNSLKDGTGNPGEVEAALSMLARSVKRMKSKIDELASLGKAQEENRTRSGGVRIREVLHDVLVDLGSEINASGAEIISDFSGAPVIPLPRKDLESVLQNLISNAVKFASPGRKPIVVIETVKNGGFISLRVSDNGRGIGEEDKNRVFLMYRRLDTGIKGSGVGLAIVKGIVENAGGNIGLESTPGGGSVFKILLPALS
jgi:PAS domain S-box-containing protein